MPPVMCDSEQADSEGAGMIDWPSNGLRDLNSSFPNLNGLRCRSPSRGGHGLVPTGRLYIALRVAFKLRGRGGRRSRPARAAGPGGPARCRPWPTPTDSDS